jgi:hypothetical protein
MLKIGERTGFAREVSFYLDPKKNLPAVAVRLEIVSPDQGEIVYKGFLDAKNAHFTGRDLRALGWASDKLEHAKDEIETAADPINFTIDHAKYINSKNEEQFFPVVKKIGFSSMPGHDTGALAIAIRSAEALILESDAQAARSTAPAAEDKMPF